MMCQVEFGPHAFSPAELSDQLGADRREVPYLLLRDGGGRQRLLALDGARVAVGRQPGVDLVIDWDPEVSRVHAQLERVGDQWTVVDDGLSRNGTFVNEVRVVGRRRIADRDVLRFGSTPVLFRDPSGGGAETVPAEHAAVLAGLTGNQRRVLVALCRPLLGAAPGTFPTPATNRAIAEEAHLSQEGVRTAIKALFARFEIPDLPQNSKRAELARRALAAGVVSLRDLQD